MDRLRRLFEYINAQMSVLTVSQRIAIGMCAALLAGSLLWLLQWSAAPDMPPLLAHEFSLDELSAAEAALESSGLPFEIRGTRIYVRTADRHNLLRVLHAGDALPQGSLFDMQAVVHDENPFRSPEALAYAQNYAKGNELAKIIATYPFVKKASVLINPSTKRRLGAAADVPSASVTVTLAPGKDMTEDCVEGFAKLVSGAVGGLKPYNVNVVDARTGQSYSFPRPNEVGTLDHLRIVQKHEERLLAKVRSGLADIPGVQATVTVELDTGKRVKQTILHDPPQPKIEFGQSSEQSSPEQPAEPGVVANVGQAVTAGGAGVKNMTEQTNVENFEPKPRETETIEHIPFAMIKSVTATVGIPRSFIVSIFQAKNPETPDPQDDDAAFAALRDEQLARIKGSVEKIVMAKSPDDVKVNVYPDLEWKSEGGTWNRTPDGVVTAETSIGGVDPVGLLRGYGPQAGLGLLAVMSMFMMMRIVRRSSQAIPPATPYHEPPVPGGEEPILTAGVHPVGQAAVPESLLMGREVDDTTLRYQELSSEVSKLIDEDPDGVADLIRQWVEQAD